MRFLLDQGLPRSAVSHLAHQGIASEHVGVLGLATATDEAILEQGPSIIRQVKDAVPTDLLAGAAVTVSVRRIAVRRLPLVSRSGSSRVP